MKLFVLQQLLKLGRLVYHMANAWAYNYGRQVTRPTSAWAYKNGRQVLKELKSTTLLMKIFVLQQLLKFGRLVYHMANAWAYNYGRQVTRLKSNQADKCLGLQEWPTSNQAEE